MFFIEVMEYGIIDGVIDKDVIIFINGLFEVFDRVKFCKENLVVLEDFWKFLIFEILDDEIY